MALLQLVNIGITTQLTLLLLWFTKSVVLPAAAAEASVAKEGCKAWCGGVEIPYPFGMNNSNCYFNDWYNIECRRSHLNGRHKPFLKEMDLEVRYISLQRATVQVNIPVMSWNCPNSNSDAIDGNSSIGSVGNLGRDSPFKLSETQNKFMVVGCNTLGLMIELDDRTIGGCVSICDTSSSYHKYSNYNPYGYRNNRCSGINCCQTTIPWGVQAFKVNVTSTKTINQRRVSTEVKEDCTHALLVDQNWFMYDSISNRHDVEPWTHVPALLDWALLSNHSATPSSFGITSPTATAHCWDESLFANTTSSINGTSYPLFGFTCHCWLGYRGNPYLPNGCQDNCGNNSRSCTFFTTMDRRRKLKMIIVGVCSGIGGLLLLGGGTWWLYQVMKKRNIMKRKEKFFKKNGGFLLQQQLSSSDNGVEQTKLFKSEELEKATDHYNEDRILGQGGQGTVYKGMLSDGRIVAVKKSKIVDERKVEQFINEVYILSKIVHRNVVTLFGCCLETEVPLLVYEFISNGTLLQHIHDPNEEFPLTWETRLRIATEVAGALSYLHNAALIPIYHRDIKSTNILLDDKYRAKVSDFGTSRSVAIDQTHLTTLVQGTFGYLDPEYFQSSQFTEKSDVYSFGVVIVELLTGQKAISSTRPQQGSRSLATFFIQSMEENRLVEILDPRILKEGQREEMVAVARLANRCLNLNGKKRPTMKEVVVELEGIRMSQGGYATQQNCEEVEYSTTDLTEAWDVASTTTGTCFDSGIASSLEIQPLMLAKP